MYFDPRTITAEQLFDPSVTQTDLATIATVRPDLWQAIAAHPKVYPALSEWIAQQTRAAAVAAPSTVPGATESAASNPLAQQPTPLASSPAASAAPVTPPVYRPMPDTNGAAWAPAASSSYEPAPSGATSSDGRTRRWWPVVVAVILVVAFAIGGWLWTRSSAVDSFSDAVKELSSSIDAAEDAANAAQDEVSAYANELTRTGSEDKQKLVAEARERMNTLNSAIDEARKVVPKAQVAAENGGSVPVELQTEVRQATKDVNGAVNQVKQTTSRMKLEQKKLAALPDKASSDSGEWPAMDGCTAPVDGAYPCAGKKSIPAGAKDLQTFNFAGETDPSLAFAAFGTPSGRLNCSINSADGVTCLQDDWTPQTANRDPSTVDGTMAASMRPDGQTDWIVKSDSPDWANTDQMGNFKMPVLPYGSVWKWKDWVVASSKQGLTIWTIKTGHGALLNSAGIHSF